MLAIDPWAWPLAFGPQVLVISHLPGVFAAIDTNMQCNVKFRRDQQ